MSSFKKNILHILIYFFTPIVIKCILYLITLLFFSLIVFLKNISYSAYYDFVEYINLFTTVFSLIISLFLFKHVVKNKFKFSFKVNLNLSILIFIVIGVSLNVLLHLLFTSLPVNIIDQSLKTHNINISYIIILGIITPILEELIFRGYIEKELSNCYKFGISCIVQSFLFALIHFNLFQFSYTFILGIILTIINEKYKSLFPSIIIHIAFNLTNQAISNVYISYLLFYNRYISFLICIMILAISSKYIAKNSLIHNN